MPLLDWKKLVHLSDAELGKLDVAAVNLACAAGLPDAGDLRAEECLDRLNHYARCLADYTDKCWFEFRRRPEAYDHSENLFRGVCMFWMLHGRQGVRYNPVKIPVEVPLSTADTFIHGTLVGDGGTCASVPVVYAAVGQRLGYPLRLALAAHHCFLRWEEPDGERFNIEVNNTSMDTPSDDYYRKWPRALTADQERDGCYLQSMTPRQELAVFLSERGYKWRALGRDTEAAEAFLWSLDLWPERLLFGGWVCWVLMDWGKRLRSRLPPHLRAVMHYPSPRRYRAVPEELERRLNSLSALEQAVVKAGWERRPGFWPPRPVLLRVSAQPSFDFLTPSR